MKFLIKAIIIIATLLALFNTYLIDYSYKHYLVVVMLGAILYGVFSKYSILVTKLNADTIIFIAVAVLATLIGVFVSGQTINQGLYDSFLMFSVLSIGYFYVGIQKLTGKF